MKNLFVIALMSACLGGCASMDGRSAYRGDADVAESDYRPLDLSSVQYLHALDDEDAMGQDARADSGQVVARSPQRNSLLYWGDDSDRLN